MKELTVILSNPQEKRSLYDIINEDNFEEQVARLGALLCGGWTVKIGNTLYTPTKLPDFLAQMHRLKDIGDIYNDFLPYITYVQHVGYIQVSEFLEKNQDLQNKIKDAVKSVMATESK